MICNHCGAENKDGSTFCSSCGKLIQDQKNGKRPSPLFVAIGAIITVGVLVTLGHFLFPKIFPGKSEAPVNATTSPSLSQTSTKAVSTVINPDELETINIGNIGNVEELARWGNGVIYDYYFINNDQQIMVVGSEKISIYDANTFYLISTFKLPQNWGLTSYDPINNRLAYCTDKVEVRVSDLNTQKDITIIPITTNNSGYYKKFYCGIKFSQDGDWIAAIDNFSVKIWKAQSGEFLYEFNSEGDTIAAFSLSSDKTKLAISHYGTPTQIWDIKSHRILFTIDNPLGNPFSFSPDNNLIAYSPYNTNENIARQVQIRHADDGSMEKTIYSSTTGRGFFGYPQFSLSSQFISACDIKTKEIIIWNVNDGTVKTAISVKNCSQSSKFNKPETKLVINSTDHMIIWDLQKDKQIGKIEGFSLNTGSCSILPNRDLVAENSEKLCIRNPLNGNELFASNMPANVSSIVIAGDGRKIALSTGSGVEETVTLYDIELMKEITHFSLRDMADINFSSDSKLIFNSVLWLPVIQVRESKNGSITKEISTGYSTSSQPYIYNFKSDSSNSFLSFATSFISLAGSRISEVNIWDLANDQKINTLTFLPENDYLHPNSFFTDGSHLIVGNGNEILIWNYRTSIIERTIYAKERQEIQELFFDKNYSMIITVNSDGTINFYDYSSGNWIKQITQKHYFCGFSSNMKYLAVSSGEGTLSVYGIPK